MKKKLISLVASVFLITTLPVFAANMLKIGVVDMNQVSQSSPLMISLNNSLGKKFKPRQDEINNATKQLQDEMNQLDTQAANMKPDDRNTLQNKILVDKANIQILTTSFQRDLAIAKDQDLQTFTSKLTSVINKIAQDGHYDIIEQQNNMLFVNSTIDITKDVLNQLR